jgi:hypothetical protein
MSEHPTAETERPTPVLGATGTGNGTGEAAPGAAEAVRS